MESGREGQVHRCLFAAWGEKSVTLVLDLRAADVLFSFAARDRGNPPTGGRWHHRQEFVEEDPQPCADEN